MMLMNELNTTSKWTLQKVADELYTTKKDYIEHCVDTLSSSLNYQDSLDELLKVTLAERYLENMGVKVKTDMYDCYRSTYDILKDLGEYLSKNGNSTLSLSMMVTATI